MAASHGLLPAFGPPPTPDSLVNKSASPASSSPRIPRSSAPTHVSSSPQLERSASSPSSARSRRAPSGQPRRTPS
eukprot:5711288-Prymnesium_polylepis.1